LKKRFSLFLTVALMLTLVAVPAFAKTSVRPGDNGKVEVTFTYAGNLDANAVYVAGEFNNWLPNFPTYKMKKENGVWTLTTQLEKGKYQYKFTVYGGGMLQWIKDDEAASFAADGFGGQNSVVIADPNAGLADRVVALEKQMAVTNIGFNYNGYARMGYMMSGRGGAQSSSFQQDGAWSKYRLGNETDHFIENTLSKKWTGDNGAWAKATFLFAHQDNSNGGTWLNSEDSNFVWRQAYAEAGGMDFAPNLTFWAGRRYYNRRDIHITDFYWRDMSGVGAGVQGIDAGIGKLAVAFLGASDGSNDVDLGAKSQQTLDFTLSGIEVPGGTLELDLAPSWSKSVEGEDDQDGFILGGVYDRTDFFGLKDGASTVALYYGSGLGGNLSTGATWADEDRELTRFVAYGVANLTDNLDLMPVLTYQVVDDGTSADDTKWLSLGGRLVQYVTNNFAMQYEYGMDKVTDNGIMHKLTVAPTIKWNSSFWARPELRFFGTYATWDKDEVSGRGGYANDEDSGFTYGVQTELWW